MSFNKNLYIDFKALNTQTHTNLSVTQSKHTHNENYLNDICDFIPISQEIICF